MASVALPELFISEAEAVEELERLPADLLVSDQPLDFVDSEPRHVLGEEQARENESRGVVVLVTAVDLLKQLNRAIVIALLLRKLSGFVEPAALLVEL